MTKGCEVPLRSPRGVARGEEGYRGMARYLAVEGRILLLSCSDRALILHINNALIPYYVLLGCRLNTGLHPGDKEGRGGSGKGRRGKKEESASFFLSCYSTRAGLGTAEGTGKGAIVRRL